MRILRTAFACIFVLAAVALASVFGSVTGIIHDPDHRPIAGATVTLTSTASAVALSATTDANGAFKFPSVAAGAYTLTAEAPQFAAAARILTVLSGRTLDLHQQLRPATVKQDVVVTTPVEDIEANSAAATTLISAKQIHRTPGADSANSFSMITDYVPSAVMVHDQLHVRGGHQVTWMIDGVPVPNTNIASNVGPQFDPKNIEFLEMQTGGYSAEQGDRTYASFNIVPRSGFERESEGELIAGYGSQNTTDNQLSFGGHTERFAYYTSAGGYRSDLGLETPIARALHDLDSGQNIFTSLTFNRTPRDQFRFIGAARNDHYQVPNDLDLQAAGVADAENERDVFSTFTWLHAFGRSTSLAVSPFFHFNQAHYSPARAGPIMTNSDRGSNYLGGSLAATSLIHGNSLRAGGEGFAQRENDLFSNFGSGPAVVPFRSRTFAWGSNVSAYLEDQYRPVSWLNINGGVRLTRFSGAFIETAADPRIGAGLTLPKLHWVLHAFYGRYYQAPPLLTLGNALSEAAANAGLGFLPLHGERDQQREFGITIPLRDWSVESTYFHTSAVNYFDHDVLGNSNVFLPLTIANARIRGWETTVRSPTIAERARVHLAYSHQFAEGRGGVSGGLTDFQPPDSHAYFLLDHDQRDTLSVGGDLQYGRNWFAANLNYGSGFVDGDGPQHLPAHSTADLSLGRDFNATWSAKLSATNLANTRYLIDADNSFGGTHIVAPRRIALQLRYRFHY